MTDLKQKTILIVGADELITPDFVRAFRAKGSKVHCLEVPFLIPINGSGVVCTENEAWLSEEMDRISQSVGSIDILLNCISLSARKDQIEQPSFSAVYAAVLMQLSRAIKSVLPGMIIRQKGHVITLVTGERKAVEKADFHAAITAAAALADRMRSAVRADNIHTSVLFDRKAFGVYYRHALATKVIELTSQPNEQNARSRRVDRCLRLFSDAIDEASFARLN